MKIAISTDGKMVSAHFGRCPSFTMLEIEDGKVTQRSDVPNPGHEPGFIPRFLHEQGVQCIVAGGMGRRAQDLFSQTGIDTVMGVTGGVDDVIKQILDGTLQGGESLCSPGAGKGYGVEKEECDHENGQE
ncbi:MAG: NifB/NifX family molybdenum-iron cluster-binding protein [Spirochaetes bacterium]|nr:NifB/NifX family molybdenum-iron cluster-binding protein [Spirochaetota bacterium]